MQLWRPSNMQLLAFSRFIGLTSIYLGPLMKSFLKALFLMIHRSPATICLWYISTKRELLMMIMKTEGGVRSFHRTDVRQICDLIGWNFLYIHIRQNIVTWHLHPVLGKFCQLDWDRDNNENDDVVRDEANILRLEIANLLRLGLRLRSGMSLRLTLGTKTFIH